jgi:hypothetical protein
MRRLNLLILTVFISISSFAQVEIAPFVGYMFGSGVDYYEGRLKIYDGMNYGGSLIIPVREIIDVEVNYSRLDSRAKFTAYRPGYNDATIDRLSTNYFQIGVLKAISVDNDKIRPFGSFSLGATMFHSGDTDKDVTDVWRFSMTAGLGVKIFITERVGIMLRGRLMMPMNFAGVGFYYGIGGGGSGGGLSLNSYAAMAQGDFNAGLIFKLGN